MKKLLTFDEFVNESATDRFLQSAASNLVKQMKNKAISKDTLMNKLNSMPLAAKLKSDELDIIVNYAMSIIDEDLAITEAASVPSNVLEFAKRKGSYATALVKKAADWAEKAGKRITNGTAIGKDYSTIILDIKHQGSEIYINLEDETIELFGEEVKDAKSFAKVLKMNESEKIHESKGYEGDVDTAEDIIDLIYELPNSIQSLRLPFDIKGKSMLDLTPSKDKDWKEKATAVIKDIVGKEGNRLKFKLKSHFGRGGDNEPYYLIIIK